MVLNTSIKDRAENVFFFLCAITFLSSLFDLHTSYNFALKVTAHTVGFGEGHFRGNRFNDFGAFWYNEMHESLLRVCILKT